MLSGPTLPKWFAPELRGAFRVREFEMFLRNISILSSHADWIPMEIEYTHNYRVNCKKTTSSWLERWKMRRERPSFARPDIYRPTNLEDLKELKDYLVLRGRYTVRVEELLKIWRDKIKNGDRYEQT